MPKIGASSETISGIPPLPPGVYHLQCKGFEPKKAKSSNTINLNPILEVINHPTENGKRAFYNLNVSAKSGWYMNAFSHGFGFPMVKDGDQSNLPGDFNGPESEPDKWQYVGPLLGAITQAEVGDGDNGKGGVAHNKVKRFICSVAGCQEKHPTDLN